MSSWYAFAIKRLRSELFSAVAKTNTYKARVAEKEDEINKAEADLRQVRRTCKAQRRAIADFSAWVLMMMLTLVGYGVVVWIVDSFWSAFVPLCVSITVIVATVMTVRGVMNE